MTSPSPVHAPRDLGEQPWFVLNSSRYRVINTRHPAISHFYALDIATPSDLTFAVPDGCVDILFDCDASRPGAKLCGTPLKAQRVDLLHQHRYFGVRFRPGVIPGFAQNLAEDLAEQQIDLQDLLPNAQDMIESITREVQFDEQMALFNGFAPASLSRTTSALTTLVIDKVLAHRGDIRISQLEALSGYTERTLQRQFRHDTGMTPKTFCRIIRCQAALSCISNGFELSFSDLAQDLGFTDQSHFLRDFKQLISTTPNDYQRQLIKSAGRARIDVTA
ncbi:AraC family transcriptional regulator [Pseudomonas sp. Leaf127]|uniref:helix-turn-helix transcriptional regulator n=1 Tax=Pseudomonas sp. Leaf127 TaxID=1736267 RepID=UPI000703C1C6|nr:helix-turn-helix transcriptional regulator [Pseudomonas sp. Leaf127]KQQ55690.1 AraC family transcriptional regulator [Pseudomonas sp. Leaf127]